MARKTNMSEQDDGARLCQVHKAIFGSRYARSCQKDPISEHDGGAKLCQVYKGSSHSVGCLLEDLLLFAGW